MKEQTKVSLSAIGAIWVQAVQWIISVALVRLGGYAQAGTFALAMAEANVFIGFCNYGLRAYQVTDTERRFLDSQYILTRLTTISASCIACSGYLLLCRDFTFAEKIAIFLYYLFGAANYYSDTLHGQFQLNNRLDLVGFSNIIRGSVCFVSFLLAFLLSHSLIFALGAQFLASLATMCFFDMYKYQKMKSSRLAFNHNNLRAVYMLLKDTFPLMVSTLLPFLVTAIPRRAIQIQFGTEALGYYSTVFTPTVIIMVLLPNLITSLSTPLAQSWNTDNRSKSYLIIISYYLGTILFTALALLCAFLVGRPIMALLFGSGILPYFPLLYAAILVSGINCMRACGTTILTVMRHCQIIVVFNIVAVVIVYFGSPYFVFRWELYGASYVLCLAYGLQALGQVGVILYSIMKKSGR